ncbi:MAG: hypothetical protein GY796_25835 [Chloroflexi bacterium]|nr:hypothetical protein [Chloroflexota bacterium]
MKLPLSSRQWIIVGLTAATAVIHLILGFGVIGETNPLFILNGVGYLVLIVGLYFLPQLAAQRGLIRWALLGYTAVTFILYFVFNWPEVWGPLGLIDKATELILIIMLWLDKE